MLRVSAHDRRGRTHSLAPTVPQARYVGGHIQLLLLLRSLSSLQLLIMHHETATFVCLQAAGPSIHG